MIKFDVGVVYVVIRTAIVYVCLFAGIRIFGKREVGQMAPNDLVLLLLLANAVQNAMTGPDVSVTGGIAAAGTLLILNSGVAALIARFPRLRRAVQGSATILVYQGQVLSEHLARERLSVADLEQALREHGVAAVGEVYLAVLEMDGSISVLKTDEVPNEEGRHRRIRGIKRT